MILVSLVCSICGVTAHHEVRPGGDHVHALHVESIQISCYLNIGQVSLILVRLYLTLVARRLVRRLRLVHAIDAQVGNFKLRRFIKHLLLII